MMELFELRTIVDNTPNSSWEEVIARDVLLIIKTCYAIVVTALLFSVVMVVLGWLDKFREVIV